MENEKDNTYYNPFYHNNNDELNQSNFSFLREDNNITQPSQNFQLGSFDPSHHASFTDYLQGSMDYNTLSRAFDLSCSSSEVISSIDENNKKLIPSKGDSLVGISENQSTTHNSFESLSSNEAEAVIEEDSTKNNKKEKQPKECEDGDEKSKKE